MSVVIERYKSLESLLKTIESRPNGQNWSYKRSHDKDERFFGTKTYNESVELAKCGYKKPLEEIKSGVSKLTHTAAVKRNRPASGIIGYAPHVPNAIVGIPNSMICKESVSQPQKIITLLFSRGYAGHIQGSSIIKAGINFLGLVNTLELNGYRVAIDVMMAGKISGEWNCLMVNLKDHRQQIDYLKLTYPLVHPSMQRRTKFRWLETAPEITACDEGYGKPLYYEIEGYENQVNWLKENGILQNNAYYIDGNDAINRTPDELIKLCGIK